MDIQEALNTIAEMCNALNLNPNSKQGQAMLMAIDALKKNKLFEDLNKKDKEGK